MTDANDEVGWTWRNCRELSLQVTISVWPWWYFQTFREDDVCGGKRGFAIGPLIASIEYGIGNKDLDL